MLRLAHYCLLTSFIGQVVSLTRLISFMKIRLLNGQESVAGAVYLMYHLALLLMRI